MKMPISVKMSFFGKLGLQEVFCFFQNASKSTFSSKTPGFSKKVTVGNILDKDIFSSSHVILNLNLNNLHLVLELVYLISALIVKDEQNLNKFSRENKIFNTRNFLIFGETMVSRCFHFLVIFFADAFLGFLSKINLFFLLNT